MQKGGYTTSTIHTIDIPPQYLYSYPTNATLGGSLANTYAQTSHTGLGPKTRRIELFRRDDTSWDTLQIPYFCTIYNVSLRYAKTYR